MKFTKKDILRVLMLVIASLLIAFNINCFVNPGNFFPGGISGLSILLQRCAAKYLSISVPYSVLNILLSIPPVYVGFRFIGKKFTLYTVIVIVLSSVFTDLVPGIEFTTNPLLLSIFGGIINSFAGSLCLHANACGGGSDFFAMYLTDKKNKDGWRIMFYGNLVLLGVAGILFGWEPALYSIIFQFTSTEMNNVFFKKYQRDTLFVVTNNPTEVCKVIFEKSNHGATILEGKGSYDNADRQLVYSVVSSDSSKDIMKSIKEVDPNAFINEVHTQSMSGNFYQEKIE